MFVLNIGSRQRCKTKLELRMIASAKTLPLVPSQYTHPLLARVAQLLWYQEIFNIPAC